MIPHLARRYKRMAFRNVKKSDESQLLYSIEKWKGEEHLISKLELHVRPAWTLI